jgi:ABC transporter
VTLPVCISFGRTVLAYALVMSQEIFAAIVRAAERAGADRDTGALPEGYQTLLGPAFIDGTDLSTGQWQRLALARTFFRDAPLVILDEPTAALDAKAEHELFARIGELFAVRSVLLISHRFSTARSADRIYVLNEGYVVESGGTHEELLAAGEPAPSFSPCKHPVPAAPPRYVRASRKATALCSRAAGWIGSAAQSQTGGRPETVRCAVSSPVRWSPPS